MGNLLKGFRMLTDEEFRRLPVAHKVSYLRSAVDARNALEAQLVANLHVLKEPRREEEAPGDAPIA